MRNMKALLLLLAAACALAACMTSQQFRERRIAARQDLFNSFSTEIQGKIRAGQVELGFSEEMVMLAWGRPQIISTRTTAQGDTTVWTYTKTRIHTETERMTIPVRVRDKAGRSSVQYEDLWVNRDTQEEYAAARVEFSRGRVTALERLHM
jgi:hypothetical protein